MGGQNCIYCRYKSEIKQVYEMANGMVGVFVKRKLIASALQIHRISNKRRGFWGPKGRFYVDHAHKTLKSSQNHYHHSSSLLYAHAFYLQNAGLTLNPLLYASTLHIKGIYCKKYDFVIFRQVSGMFSNCG